MLHCCLFLCGAALMIIELTGSRILAPFLGTSLVVWTSLIGIILASLSLGAWWGGIVADRRPRIQLLGRIVLLAAWATAAIGLSKTWVLQFLQGLGGLHLVAIMATVALFAPAAVLLGMVAPFAVRLQMEDPARIGRTAGSLYAISTIGSIAGTFLAGFVLIAWVGSTAILFITAATLVVAAWMIDPSTRAIKAVSLLAFGLALFLVHQQDRRLEQVGFLDRDTPYNRVLVYTGREGDAARLTREMVTGPHGRQSAMYLDDPTELALPYTRFYRLAEYFQPAMLDMLVIGGGGYSFPKFALARYPEVRVDVVEIDPGITALARSHFGLEEHPRLRVIEADGRTFLNQPDRRYDVILLDAFNSHYSIPFHLVTIEAVRQLRERLTPSGVVLVNILASPEGGASQFYKALFATFRAVFPEVRTYAVHNPEDASQWQNLMLVALTGATAAEVEHPPADEAIAAMLNHALPLPDHLPPPLTDEFAPVDRYISGGQPLIETTARRDS